MAILKCLFCTGAALTFPIEYPSKDCMEGHVDHLEVGVCVPHKDKMNTLRYNSFNMQAFDNPIESGKTYSAHIRPNVQELYQPPTTDTPRVDRVSARAYRLVEALWSHNKMEESLEKAQRFLDAERLDAVNEECDRDEGSPDPFHERTRLGLKLADHPGI